MFYIAWNNDKELDKSDSESAAPSTKSTVIPKVEVRYDKPVPGSTLRCLDDPIFDGPPMTTTAATTMTATSTGNRTMASDVLEKARDRFDRFWGGAKEENV